MITLDQALRALNYLKKEDNRANNEGLYQLAIKTVEEYITQKDAPNDIKVVYEFKLRRADGLYMNRSEWSKKGKTYTKRNNLAVALGSYISTAVEYAPDKPKSPNFRDRMSGKVSEQEYQEQYAAYMELWRPWNEKAHNDNEYRAQFLPEDWIVICIPVNVKSDIIEMTAREFYTGKTIEK
jgi:hypothetical protein